MMAAPISSLRLSQQALDTLMPLHVVVTSTGHIAAIGPTLRRIGSDAVVPGARLLETFEFRRPFAPETLADLVAAAGRPLSLRLRRAPRTVFKGAIVPADGDGALLMNLSFGIGAVSAVAQLGLSAADFAATDLTAELLYVVEAKTAAWEESRRLNGRLAEARRTAREQALTDALTGLRNRRAAEETLDRLCRAAAPFAVLHLDLDRFKQVNDTHGHEAGDDLLRHVAHVLRAETREADLVARMGGDEFLILIEGMSDRRGLAAIARRMIAGIESLPAPDGGPGTTSASIGLVVRATSEGPCDRRTLLRAADEALYAAKRAGRGRVAFHASDEG